MIDFYSSWLISRSINARDTSFSVLFNLLLANITILCFFFLFLVIFNSFFIIPVVKENIKLKLALGIPTGTPKSLVKEIIDIPPFVADKTVQVLSK